MREKGLTLVGSACVCALIVVPVAIAGIGASAESRTGKSRIVKKLKRQVTALSARVAALEGKPDQVGQMPSKVSISR